MKGKKLNVRLKSLNQAMITRAIKHNYRLIKLNNVDKDRLDRNYYSDSPAEIRAKIKKAQSLHKRLYKKTFKEKLRADRVNSIAEYVFTFESGFDAPTEQLQQVAEDFIKRVEYSGGGEFLSYQIHRDETSSHIHFLATSFNIKTGKTIHVKKGFKSYLQDIGEMSCSSAGLEHTRGDRKEITGSQNKKLHDHYKETLETGAKLDSKLDAGLELAEVEALIKETKPPFKTMLTYVKRSMDKEREAEDIIKQRDRALKKAREVYPNAESLESIEDILELLKNDQKAQRKIDQVMKLERE